MSAPSSVLELVERFERDKPAYKSPLYNETQTRQEFIDPLFAALGWDIGNRGGAAAAFREVVLEYSMKIGAATKAPDYLFQLGGNPRFFVEAKKPSVNLKDDTSPAFQLRRYAWSATLPLSVLTDFEEFVVYDCRVEPDKKDKATVARMLYVPYTEYADRWDSIAELFSREAVLDGSLEKFAQEQKAPKGATAVDVAFLREIEGWRELLAKNIAIWNPELSQRELNYAVQMTLDRIIFLRICEDRGIEPYGKLQRLLKGGQLYKQLVQQFRDADDRYNSGLFHFASEKGREEPDSVTPGLYIDDEPLQKVVRGLYYPDSPYEFSVLPVEILGNVYEQFLGKVIHLNKKHEAVVVEKPEVRKAGGVYYTPSYIVDYIVKQTVGKLLDGKTPKEAAKLRIVDPACGSGSFLLGAYQYLLNWYLAQYVAAGPTKHKKELYQGSGGEWKLTSATRKRILLDNLYGVDIDAQAVEVTKLSLSLKVLEGESEQTIGTTRSMFNERALPDLSNNIKCGNSLIGQDFFNSELAKRFTEDELYLINAFDWETEFQQIMRVGGFDAVIGNPPYDVMEKERGASSWPHTALAEYVRLRDDYQFALGGKLNLFRFFIVRSLSLIRENGKYGMIVPLALLADISCGNTRRHLILSVDDLVADCFPQKDNPKRRIFLDAKLSTVVIACNRNSAIEEEHAQVDVRVYPWNSFDDPHKAATICFSDLKLIDPKNLPVPLVDTINWSLCRKTHTAPGVSRLGEVADFSVTRGEINQTIYRRFIVADENKARLLKGVEIGRFQIRDKLSQGHREWLDEDAFLAANTPRPVAALRRIATQRITGVDERLRVVATVIDPPTYFADSTNSVALQNSSPYCLEYLLGLLNSKLFQWRFKLTSTNNNVGTNELDAMPFRTINFSDPADKKRHTDMVGLVERMLDLHKRVAASKTGQERSVLQRQIEGTDKQIDKLVYELYGLSDEEIAIVEQATT